MATSYLRLFTAAFMLLSVAACNRKDYNASPSGSDSTNAVNPLLPLGTADEAGQIRYKRWNEKVRMKTGRWQETNNGGYVTRSVVGSVTANGIIESIGLQIAGFKATRAEYNNNDSSFVTVVLRNTTDTTAISGYYSSFSYGAMGKAKSSITITDQNAITMKGTFSGRLYSRNTGTFEIDTNNYIEITEGSFFVNK